MDAVYWFAVGSITGITLTAIELRSRWVRDRNRLQSDLAHQIKSRQADARFNERFMRSELGRLNRELDRAWKHYSDAQEELHTIKRQRLEAWKGEGQ